MEVVAKENDQATALSWVQKGALEQTQKAKTDTLDESVAMKILRQQDALEKRMEKKLKEQMVELRTMMVDLFNRNKPTVRSETGSRSDQKPPRKRTVTSALGSWVAGLGTKIEEKKEADDDDSSSGTGSPAVSGLKRGVRGWDSAWASKKPANMLSSEIPQSGRSAAEAANIGILEQQAEAMGQRKKLSIVRDCDLAYTKTLLPSLSSHSHTFVGFCKLHFVVNRVY